MYELAMFLIGAVIGGMVIWVCDDTPLLPHRDEQ